MREPRLRSLLVVLALVGTPAVVLRAFCVGNACPAPPPPAPRVPFCSLPEAYRDLVVAGFRDGRSPEVLAAAGDRGVVAEVNGHAVAWPGPSTDTRVPLVFLGDVGIDRLPRGARLDQVAPTLAAMLGFDRPFPGVRSGTALDGVATGATAPLAVTIVWKHVGTPDLEAAPDAWPALRHTIRDGAGTLDAAAGSLPLDPAATLTTIGTGGLPAQHGITGSLVRGDDGRLVGAWSRRAPISVIATLADDLDERTSDAAKIGLVGTEALDRGLVGGTWYVGGDRDDVTLGGDPVAAVRRMLDAGYGADGVPDVLAIALEGPIARMDARTAAIVRLVRSARPDAAIAITASGSTTPAPTAVPVEDLEGSLATAASGSLVEAVAADGVFVDADAAAAAGVGTDPIAQVLARARAGGDRALADAYPAFSVSLARYC
jgi:hypothetical protein